MIDLKTPERKFRPELEGIRAVAALLVAIYHIWLGSVSGGVDVFFIVSGYLITTLILSKMEKEGWLNLFEYVLGLARRLFPLAFTVLLVTTIASIFILPHAHWGQTIPQVFASALYYQNWQLAYNAVDYLAQNNEASPFQHYWALSIQGQFYLLWPLIIYLSFFLARKLLKTPVRKTLLAILSLIFITSLSYSIYITTVNQPWAYFDTFARVWEFSLGGILALLIPYLSFQKTVSLILGWIGLMMILLTGILLPVSNVFPGYAALLPTTGVMFVIIAAESRNRFGVEKLLGAKLLAYLGNFSYGLYLWHWPVLIFYYDYFLTDTVSILGGLAIIFVSLALSMISVKLLETPVRTLNVKKSKAKLTIILVSFMFPVLIVATTWSLYVTHVQGHTSDTHSIEDYPGARAIFYGIEPTPGLDPLPNAVQAKAHLPTFYNEEESCYAGLNVSKVIVCSYGETENPDYTLALVGGSHSGHWFPALEKIAEELKLQIDVYNKDGCRFSDDDFDGILSESCMEWNENVLEPLLVDPPDFVFTTANVNRGDIIPSGYLNQWRKLEGATQILAIRDNPRMAEDIPTCVELTPDECAISREEGLSDVIPWDNTEGIPSNVTFIDLSDYFCNEETCEAVIGNVLVYRDNHHLSTLYSETLAPALKERIIKAIEQLNN
ncbi:acyltransferase [Alkalihalobacillus sp. MEB130]|uniref:acyltransferase family protein n=1 Tax=Alkalihalobacillus sp. MEB130 TaxID=2976704 RepID=UPI0028DF8C49|nr:acyltransferase family protein [Alkalihalobacillus sp. MEB130]MDT8858821.1 acyltransferase [Alkalihalobacillus sp. MEB130]